MELVIIIILSGSMIFLMQIPYAYLITSNRLEFPAGSEAVGEARHYAPMISKRVSRMDFV